MSTSRPRELKRTAAHDREHVLLDAYAARSCPVKTHNAYDPTVPLSPGETVDGLTEFFDGGQKFEAVVMEQLITSCRGQVVDLRLLGPDEPTRQTDACVRAMASGAEVIIGGLLPVDGPGHRVGRPDLLVRGADRLDGTPGYHPVEVKWHKICEPPRPPIEVGDEPPAIRYSSLGQPAPASAAVLPGQSLRVVSRWADLVQLAHYHRMLEACGHAAGPAAGAVIGTDGLFDEPVLVWADLNEPLLRTFSRSRPEGWRLRSALERYDFEHAFRLEIAAVARQQTGHPERDPAPLVTPIVNQECGRCPWWEHCLPQLHPDDVSLRIDKGALDSREIVTLRRRGITTITDLVDVDLDQLLEWYLPEVTHRSGAEARLRTAARRARMLLEGTWFARETTGPIEVPAADIEIDFDIESAVDGRIYLWGFLVDGIYSEFSRFEDLDDASETALAVEALRWLRSVIDTGDRVVVYHYSGYEVARIRALADREHDPLLDWAAAYAEEHFVDLLEIVKGHYFGVAGLGLKLMAKHAGFRWRDDDPGGLNSQLWFADAVHAAEPGVRAAAQQRVLEYNEDDVIATSQVRAWLRAQ